MLCRFGRHAVLQLLMTQTWVCGYAVHLSPGPWLFWYLARVSLCRRSNFWRHAERQHISVCRDTIWEKLVDCTEIECMLRFWCRFGLRLRGCFFKIKVLLPGHYLYVLTKHRWGTSRWIQHVNYLVSRPCLFRMQIINIYTPRPSSSTPKRRVPKEYMKLTIIKLSFMSCVRSYNLSVDRTPFEQI
jgi:hypothetical protein